MTPLVIFWPYQFCTNWFHTLCSKYEEHWHNGTRHDGVKLENRFHSLVIPLYDLLIPDTMVKSWGAVSQCGHSHLGPFGTIHFCVQCGHAYLRGGTVAQW